MWKEQNKHTNFVDDFRCIVDLVEAQKTSFKNNLVLMSYVVHVTAVVEGDIDKIEGLINQYRYKCLENQPGMQQFYVCRHLEQQNVFLYTQIFKDQEAHQSHLEGDDPKWFFQQMEDHEFSFQGQWVAGMEIESSSGQILN